MTHASYDISTSPPFDDGAFESATCFMLSSACEREVQKIGHTNDKTCRLSYVSHSRTPCWRAHSRCYIFLAGGTGLQAQEQVTDDHRRNSPTKARRSTDKTSHFTVPFACSLHAANLKLRGLLMWTSHRLWVKYCLDMNCNLNLPHHQESRAREHA